VKWVTAGQFKTWISSNQRQCADTLPELVRRLILATSKSIQELDFPSGDAVSGGGWDGTLKTDVVSPFFPTGTSGWEMGTGAAEAKAEGDYTKRCADSLGIDPKDSTFVFVTPRPWPGRTKWRNEKAAEGKWKGIKVINADSLEQWLDSAPAVALWLARKMGNVSGGVRDIECTWEEWSQSTTPFMTTDLVIGGRDSDVEEIHKWLRQPAAIRAVQGDSPDEAAAFLYAAIKKLPDEEQAKAFSRCVVVDTPNDFRECSQSYQDHPLIIVAPGHCLSLAGSAVNKGHHVFIGMDSQVISFKKTHVLSRPRRDVVEKKLQEAGLSEADAQRYARDCGHSIAVLRRQLSPSSAVVAPSWANAASAQLLAPILLAGSWQEGLEGDQKAITALSGKSHAAYSTELDALLSVDDSAIRKVERVRMLKSPVDAWFLLARHLTDATVKVFCDVAYEVFIQTNPKYELAEDKRWSASIYGKSSQYSEWLRTGMAETLVLLAVHGDVASNVSAPQALVEATVKKIFGDDPTWEKWASLKDVTPLLAEAAPEAFLSAVEKTTKEKPEVFKDLFRDEDGMFGECKHSGLLWGLESLAWSSDYLARAASVLLELSRIDPGGRYANRPANSLREIFLPGLPQTHATPKERLDVIDLLIAKNPKIVWDFMRGYYGGGTISESHRFRWRSTGGERRGLEREAVQDDRAYTSGLFPKVLSLACEPSNAVLAMDDFTRLPPPIQEALVSFLKDADVVSFTENERKSLLVHVREALNWINGFGEAGIKTHVAGLTVVLEKFTPKETLERVGWLLHNPWPRLPEGEPREYDEKDARVKKAQEAAAAEILNDVSTDKIVEFGNTLENAFTLGRSLGLAVRNKKEDDELSAAILSQAAKNPALTNGYAAGRVAVKGASWIDARVREMKTGGGYPAEAFALLYFGLPEGMETWRAVAAQGKDVELAYWKYARGYSLSDKTGDAQWAVEKMLDAKRPMTALEVAGDDRVTLPSGLIQRLIQELLDASSKNKELQMGGMGAYYLSHVFNQLYRQNDLPIEEIAMLEWPFAALFDDLGRELEAPLAIYRVLDKDPLFFAKLISFQYLQDGETRKRGSGPEDEEKDDPARIIARNAHHVLHSWPSMPGLGKDGSIDEELLIDWVTKAREQCAATKHVTGCDIEIGQMLARSPAGNDGIWPHPTVRNLIETLNNDVIDRHVEIGIYNGRGVVSRGLRDGGSQERKLMEKYQKMSEEVKTKWPRTSALLRAIARSYEDRARHEDVDTDLWELR